MSGRRASGPPGGRDESGLWVGGISLAALTAASTVWLPIELTDAPGYTGGGPFRAAAGLIRGQIHWTMNCTVIAVGEGFTVGVIVALITWGVRRYRRGRTRVDDAARNMASRRDLQSLSPEGVREAALRLRPSLIKDDKGNVHVDDTGVLIGFTVNGRMALRQSYEDMAVDIWGPRTGKTTARAIPAIVAHSGPVLVTSTKGDVADASREIRAARGFVWMFDVQNLFTSGPQMWWNPLEGITTITAARRLADHFAAAERPANSVPDAFFDPKGQDLVANLLLAAAASGRTVIDAYRWSVSPRDELPAELLAEHGYELPAESIRGVLNMPDKTRGGIYASAEKMLMCLTEPSVTRWVTPPATDRLANEDQTVKQFSAKAFVRSTDTLYLLCEGGPGSPAPLIAALTDAVLVAGTDRARTLPGRRLDPPLLCVLDEAGNICRLRQLASQYSYLGSAGICIITILQSYAQGVEVWGRDGMRKLWSSANIRTYGGGVADPDFLEELSKLIGETDIVVRSTTTSGTGFGDRSVSHQPQRRRVLEVSDLHAMPRGRAVVYSSGNPPALVRTQPWQEGPYADAVRASLAKWDPEGQYDTELSGDQPAGEVNADGPLMEPR